MSADERRDCRKENKFNKGAIGADDLRKLAEARKNECGRMVYDAMIAAAGAWEAQNKANEMANGELAIERDSAILAEHLVQTRIDELEGRLFDNWGLVMDLRKRLGAAEKLAADTFAYLTKWGELGWMRAADEDEGTNLADRLEDAAPRKPESWTDYCARMWRHRLPERYRPSLRQDSLYEIFLYPDDPAYQAAERYLTKRTFSALSAGYSFIGRPEDYARFEAAIRTQELS